MDEYEDEPIKCKTIEEAITKAQEIDNEYDGVEYGISFVGKLKTKPFSENDDWKNL
jgi:hypothetical protein